MYILNGYTSRYGDNTLVPFEHLVVYHYIYIWYKYIYVIAEILYMRHVKQRIV